MSDDNSISWVSAAEDYQLSFVPGVDRCPETKYSRNKNNPAFIKRNKSSSTIMPSKSRLRENKSDSEEGGGRRSSSTRSVSLKDLCPEDKRRVAHLVQELANLQEEKDEIGERFRVERENFCQQLESLTKDKRVLLEEKAAVEARYVRCQEMVREYQHNIARQQQLATQQIKLLNQTVREAHYNSSNNNSPRLHQTSTHHHNNNNNNTSSVRHTSLVTSSRRASVTSSLDHRDDDDEPPEGSKLPASVKSSARGAREEEDDDKVSLKSRGSTTRGSRERSRMTDDDDHDVTELNECSARRRHLAAERAALELEQTELKRLLRQQQHLLRRYHDGDHDVTPPPLSADMLTSPSTRHSNDGKRQTLIGSPRIHSTLIKPSLPCRHDDVDDAEVDDVISLVSSASSSRRRHGNNSISRLVTSNMEASPRHQPVLRHHNSSTISQQLPTAYYNKNMMMIDENDVEHGTTDHQPQPFSPIHQPESTAVATNSHRFMSSQASTDHDDDDDDHDDRLLIEDIFFIK